MQLLHSSLKVTKTRFLDNFAQRSNNGITLIKSKLEGSNLHVSYTKGAPSKAKAAESENGAAPVEEEAVESESEFDVHKVTTGFFSLYMSSDLTLKSDSTFENVRAQNYALISASQMSSLHVSDNVNFKNLTALVETGGSTIGLENMKLANIIDAVFRGNPQTNVLVRQGPLTVSKSMFTDGANGSHLLG